MKNKTKLSSILIMAFLLCILTLQISVAYSINSVSITSVVDAKLNAQETIILSIDAQQNEQFEMIMPQDVSEVLVNGETISLTSSTLSTPLNCQICTLKLSYTTKESVKQFSATQDAYYKVMELAATPAQLTYTVTVPSNYLITNSDASQTSRIVPTPKDIRIENINTVVEWSQENPEFPMIFQIPLIDHEHTETLSQELVDDIKEPTTWFFMFIAMLIGAFGGIMIFKIYQKQPEKIAYIPSSVLSPDEKTVIALLKNKTEKINQKQIAKELNWSKSKVSAVISNLEYKKLIQREKFGRNYRVELIKNIGDVADHNNKDKSVNTQDV